MSARRARSHKRARRSDRQHQPDDHDDDDNNDNNNNNPPLPSLHDLEDNFELLSQEDRDALSRKLPGTLSETDREGLVADVVRFFLFKHSLGEVVKQSELTRDVVRKRVASKEVGVVIALASDQLQRLFGYEIRQVPLAGTVEEKKKHLFKAKNEFVLVNASADADECKQLGEADEHAHKERGLLMMVLTVLGVHTERPVPEEHLWSQLEVLNVKQKNDPVFGDTKALLRSWVTNRYVHETKTNGQSFYSFGGRAYIEFVDEFPQLAVHRFVAQVLDPDGREVELSDEVITELRRVREAEVKSEDQAKTRVRKQAREARQSKKKKTTKQKRGASSSQD